MFQIPLNNTTTLNGSWNTSLTSILFLVVVVSIVVGVFLIISFLSEILKLLNRFSITLIYVLRGGATLLVVGGLYFTGSFINDSVGGISLEQIITYSFYVVAGYSGLALLGYVVTKLGSKLKKNYSVIKDRNELQREQDEEEE